MNENIDLTKILKDSPKGWKFYSSVLGEVKFEGICDDDKKEVSIIVKPFNHDYTDGFTKEGFYFAKTGECTLFPSREQRDWSKFTAPWYNKKKFDPKTLKPFDKVLARDTAKYNWKCDLFSIIIKDACYPYKCIGNAYIYCIPYNDETKHLAGTTEEAPEYYRYWEE